MSTSLTHLDRNMVSNVVMGIEEMAIGFICMDIVDSYWS